jgi:hypothetical protein
MEGSTAPIVYSASVNTGASTPANDTTIYVVDSAHCKEMGDLSDCSDNGANPDGVVYDAVQAEIAYQEHVDQGGSTDCVVGVWHHSRFSNSSDHDNDSDMRDIYDLLDDDAGMDLVVTGHSHNYEKFPRQDADGNLGTNAPRPFVVGTGGATPTSAFDTNANGAAGYENHSAGYSAVFGTETQLDAAESDNGYLWLMLGSTGFDTKFINDAGTQVDPDPSVGPDGLPSTGDESDPWEYNCSNDPTV